MVTNRMSSRIKDRRSQLRGRRFCFAAGPLPAPRSIRCVSYRARADLHLICNCARANEPSSGDSLTIEAKLLLRVASRESRALAVFFGGAQAANNYHSSGRSQGDRKSGKGIEVVKNKDKANLSIVMARRWRSHPIALLSALASPLSCQSNHIKPERK